MVHVTPDGLMVISVGDNNSIRGWDLKAKKMLWELRPVLGRVDQLVLAPKGPRAYLAVDARSALWVDDAQKTSQKKSETDIWVFQGQSVVGRLAICPSRIDSLDVSSDGKWLVTTDRSQTVRIWEVPTGKMMRELTHLRTVVERGRASTFNEFALGAALAPDGRILATCGIAFLRLWDVETGEDLKCFRGWRYDARQLAFLPHGKRVVFARGGPPILACATSTAVG
jgi:WD40 repeat protein